MFNWKKQYEYRDADKAYFGTVARLDAARGIQDWTNSPAVASQRGGAVLLCGNARCGKTLLAMEFLVGGRSKR